MSAVLARERIAPTAEEHGDFAFNGLPLLRLLSAFALLSHAASYVRPNFSYSLPLRVTSLESAALCLS